MVFERVVELLSENLGIAAEKLSLETRLVEDLGADSLDGAELITALEDEYGISVSEDELSSLKTIGDIVTLVDKHRK